MMRLLALAALLATGVSGAESSTVPPNLNPPPGHVLIGEFAAKGVQIYRCTSGTWQFVEPAASLIGTSRQVPFHLVIHFRGPSWQSVEDGSLVEARVVASSPVAGSIAQLLLESTVTRGDGLFGKVTFVQRLATSGGAAPAGACADGQIEGVKYQAQYRFFAADGR
jgi:hypothetical protein